MRRFSVEYLADTRRGLWADREALEGLDLERRRRILDVGCGTGSLAAVLREESDAEVACLDADRALLDSVADGPRLVGDASRLPVADGAFDLVGCQALLVNLLAPEAAVAELARASSDFVAAVEPDNAAVTVDSSVTSEVRLSARARAAYLDGLETDAALGSTAEPLFEAAGLGPVTTTRHDLVREIAPPYEHRDIEAARRKAEASRLSAHERELRAGGLSAADYETLVEDWRSMGRTVVERMRAREYRRTETVPFYVIVGRV